MNRAFYSATIDEFLSSPLAKIKGILSSDNSFSLEQLQRNAWTEEIEILQKHLSGFKGKIYFEFSIPRMGKRIDVLLLIESVICIIEFKTGESLSINSGRDQVWDYALDLTNFHEGSHNKNVAPILVVSKINNENISIITTPQHSNLLDPIVISNKNLSKAIQKVLTFFQDSEPINISNWENSRYSPTPTIIEAAMALYRGHTVSDISRNDAGAINLIKTSNQVNTVIKESKENSRKSICFVTGVPGAGKTLVGLDIATKNINKESDSYSVFLSGNGPLVSILREALARDRFSHLKNTQERKVTKKEVMSEVKMFIQNVHHFRDDCLKDELMPPIEHVAIFDEAQRAWDIEQTQKFMKQKKNIADFNQSEPEFLISCLNRHTDWAVIICLVGGGQEINTGEAGIKEWIASINRSFNNWDVYISKNLIDSEYGVLDTISKVKLNIQYKDELHLSTSMRSFRSEYVSQFVKNLLDFNVKEAKELYSKINSNYSIVLTRDLKKAKSWLKAKASGSERYGMVVSSQAQRLKPYAIDVKSPVDPIHWFLDGKEDVRSSYYLEDVVTEFHIQGLELDWVCVAWDADFRYSDSGWEFRSFVGEKWNNILKEERKTYLKNAYRVLLTRARQGMIIVVPDGDSIDPTRKPEFYDPTFSYLKEIGFDII